MLDLLKTEVLQRVIRLDLSLLENLIHHILLFVYQVLLLQLKDFLVIFDLLL